MPVRAADRSRRSFASLHRNAAHSLAPPVHGEAHQRRAAARAARRSPRARAGHRPAALLTALPLRPRRRARAPASRPRPRPASSKSSAIWNATPTAEAAAAKRRRVASSAPPRIAPHTIAAAIRAGRLALVHRLDPTRASVGGSAGSKARSSTCPPTSSREPAACAPAPHRTQRGRLRLAPPPAHQRPRMPAPAVRRPPARAVASPNHGAPSAGPAARRRRPCRAGRRGSASRCGPARPPTAPAARRSGGRSDGLGGREGQHRAAAACRRGRAGGASPAWRRRRRRVRGREASRSRWRARPAASAQAR